jgi:hypothetical protein
MRANVWSGRNTVQVENVPDPKILNDRDVDLGAPVTGRGLEGDLRVDRVEVLGVQAAVVPQALRLVERSQVPQAMGNGTTTRSPTLRLPTPRPVSTTSPMNSWPRMSPFSIVGM